MESTMITEEHHEEQNHMVFLRILPTRNARFLQRVLSENWYEMVTYAHRICVRQRLEQFHEDAVCIAFQKLYGSDIIAEDDQAAVKFMMRAIYTVCVDENRRRGRQKQVSHYKQETGEYQDILDIIAYDSEPMETVVYYRQQLACLASAFEYLPDALPACFKRIKCELQLGMEGVISDRDTGARQSLCRIRALLAGWLHGHFKNRPCDIVGNQSYWKLGVDMATKYQRQLLWGRD